MTDHDLYTALRERIQELDLLIEDLIEYNNDLVDKMAFHRIKPDCECGLSTQEEDAIKESNED